MFFLEHGLTTRINKISQSEAIICVLRTILFFSKDVRHVKTVFSNAHRFTISVNPGILSFRKNSARVEILNAISGVRNGKTDKN